MAEADGLRVLRIPQEKFRGPAKREVKRGHSGGGDRYTGKMRGENEYAFPLKKIQAQGLVLARSVGVGEA